MWARIGLIWLRIWTGGEQAKNRLASQEGLCSMKCASKQVSNKYIYRVFHDFRA